MNGRVQISASQEIKYCFLKSAWYFVYAFRTVRDTKGIIKIEPLGISTSVKREQRYFFIFPPLSTTKTLNIIYKIKIRRL